MLSQARASTPELGILQQLAAQGHEQLIACWERSVGLRAFIAIYDTTLGPALGGVRVWPYATEGEALADVLRLARALAYKCAVAGVAFGGGKAVIIADPRTGKTEGLMRAFARFVDTLGGRFIVSEDVGSDVSDLEHIAQETQHVAGLPLALGGSGDPAAVTGMGVVMAMKSCARRMWGSDSLRGRVVAIQGVGKVGGHVAALLAQEEARIVVADPQGDAVEGARRLGATVVKPEEIYRVECDVFAPCALGGVLNADTVPVLKAKVVAGGANNQLRSPADGDALHARGIIYAPDYIASAGGVIALHYEVYGDFDPDLIPALAARVGAIMDRVLECSVGEGIPTYLAADRLAEQRMNAMRNLSAIRRNTGPRMAKA